MKEDCQLCGATFLTEELDDNCPFERTCPECIEEELQEALKDK